jgi:acyl-coenzyme A synthetase/AMP-(fatty) acid ligase
VHQVFNASSYLLDRRLEAGDGDRIAVTGPRGTLTYQGLYELTTRIAAGLAEIGVRPEQRVVLFTVDSPNMMATILAAYAHRRNPRTGFHHAHPARPRRIGTRRTRDRAGDQP